MTVSKRNRLKASLRNKEGSVGPIFGLLAMPMFFMIGMSIDYARAISVENSLQNALDAAALAAMQSEATDPQDVGAKMFNANFTSRNAMYANAEFTKLDDGTVRATATVTVPTTAAALIGFDTLQVETHSVVEPSHEVTDVEETSISTSNLPCIHVMDQSGAGTFELADNQDVDASDCIVKVRSNNASSVKGSGNHNVKFKRIKTKGGSSLDSGAQTGKSDYSADNNQQIVGNPYEASIRDVVQAITVGSCTTANTGKTLSGNVSPGTYCGTTEFKNATFGTGLYIIKSGSGNKKGRLKITGSANGSAGVTFYLADNQSKIESYAPNDGSVFKAPATGTTRGLLFFEDSNRGSTWDFDLNICKSNTWEGVVYLPSANVGMNMEEWTLKVSMAANQLLMDSIEDLEWDPYSWTPFNATSALTLSSEDDDVTTTTSTTTTTTDIYLKE